MGSDLVLSIYRLAESEAEQSACEVCFGIHEAHLSRTDWVLVLRRTDGDMADKPVSRQIHVCDHCLEEELNRLLCCGVTLGYDGRCSRDGYECQMMLLKP